MRIPLLIAILATALVALTGMASAATLYTTTAHDGRSRQNENHSLDPVGDLLDCLRKSGESLEHLPHLECDAGSDAELGRSLQGSGPLNDGEQLSSAQ